MKKWIKGGVIAAIAIVLLAVIMLMSTVMIKPGYVGVVYSLNGGIKGDVLTQGLNFKAPWHKVTKYTVATEQGYLSRDSQEGSEHNDSFSIPTADGKTVNVDLEYSYHFEAEMLPKTFTKFKGQGGKDIEAIFMRGKLKTWSGEVSSKFSVLDIYGEKRTELNTAVLSYVRDKFAPYGIVIDSISFSRIGLDKQTEKAVQERVNAQQELEKEKVEKEKAQIVAEKNIISAEGEAEVYRIKSAAITPELLKKWELDARLKHGWVTIKGGSQIVDTSKN